MLLNMHPHEVAAGEIIMLKVDDEYIKIVELWINISAPRLVR